MSLREMGADWELQRGLIQAMDRGRLIPGCVIFLLPFVPVPTHPPLSLSFCLPGILLLQASRGIPFTRGPGASLCAGDIKGEAGVLSVQSAGL